MGERPGISGDVVPLPRQDGISLAECSDGCDGNNRLDNHGDRLLPYKGEKPDDVHAW